MVVIGAREGKFIYVVNLSVHSEIELNVFLLRFPANTARDVLVFSFFAKPGKRGGLAREILKVCFAAAGFIRFDAV